MVKWYVVATFLGLSAVAISATEVPGARHPLLEQLVLPQDALPAGCEVPELPPDAFSVKGLKNCSVTTDPRAFDIGIGRLRAIIAPEDVEAMYLAIYKEQRNECGLYAWAFKTEDAAKEAHKQLADSYGKVPERVRRLWQVKNYVLWLQRDPGITNGLFQHLEAFVQSKVDGFGEQRSEHVTQPASTADKEKTRRHAEPGVGADSR